VKSFIIKEESLRRDHWTEVEQENFSRILDFVQNLMNDHDFDFVLKEFGNDDYVQHNRQLPAGIEGLVGFLKDFVKKFPEYCYDVKKVTVDHDHVTFHSHATLKAKHRGNESKGMKIIDTWRLENGQIVEHWDSIQPLDGFLRFYTLLTGGKVRNQNSHF